MTPLHNALTPPALVIAGLRTAIAQEIPNLSFVYDPVLHWSDTARAQRAQRDMQEGTAEQGTIPEQSAAATQYPLMGWNRSTLIPMEGRSRRNAAGGYATVTVPGSDGPQNWDLRAFFGEIQFKFKLYSRDILELEALEMGYVTNSLISDITGFQIPIGSLYPALDVGGVPPSVWNFDTQWDPLDPELQVERRPAAVFAIQGSATIRGTFLTGAVIQDYPLNTIALSLMDMQQHLTEQIIVQRVQQ